MSTTKEILTVVLIMAVVAAIAAVWVGDLSRQPAAITLRDASAGSHYDSSLQIANATLPGGKWDVVSTAGQLPPGLSVVHMEHGCIPTEPACPQNSFDLLGTPTQAGTYTFSVTFSIGGEQVSQSYRLRVLP
jgi:hypothetical protein